MNTPVLDIIVPVWNRPTETRTCLINLLSFSPDVRLILVNNGSERETENLLEEFAEGLDERAVLIGTASNRGFIRAVNMGLARAEADFAAIVRSSSLVTEGWLEPLLALLQTRSEVGVAIPRLLRAPLNRKKSEHQSTAVTEVAHGDFAAMIFRKEMYDRIGGFDEQLDGAAWCLKEFSHRARKAGYLTCAAEDSLVIFQDEVLLGSPVRRAELLSKCRAIHDRRWGAERSFCIYFPPETTADYVKEKFEVVLQGARQGHTLTLLVGPVLYRQLAGQGYTARHRNIRFTKLPRLFAAGRAGKIAEALHREDKEVVLISGVGGPPFPGGAASLSFNDLERLVEATESEKFRN